MTTSLGNRLLYGIGGGIASNIGFNIMSVFFIIFCVDVWGLNPVTAGTIVLVTRLIDTFTDPLMGAIADKTRTKLGKYRFWIIVAGPLTGVLTFLVFAGPDLPPILKVIYMYIVYISYSVISTAANIPYHSLTAYITDDPNQRRTLVMIKQLAAMVAVTFLQVVGIYITITLFDNTITGYRILGIISAILITVGFLMCAYGAREVDNFDTLQKEEEGQFIKKINMKDIFGQLKLIVVNPSLRNIAIASSTNFFATTITSAVGIYFYTIVLGDAKYAQIAAMYMLFISFISFAVTFVVSKKIGNKESFVLFTALSMLAGLITYLLFDASQPMLMVTILSIASGFSACAGVTTFIMVTDCADEIKFDTGENGAGIASSCLTFANKLGSALGGFCTGVVLSLIGYNAAATVQEPSVTTGLIIAMIFAPVLGHVFSLIAMKGYPLTKKRHAEIREALYAQEKV